MILKDLNDTVSNDDTMKLQEGWTVSNDDTMKLQEGWIKCFLCTSSSWRLQMWVLYQNVANGNTQDNLDHCHRSLHSDSHMHIWVNSLEDKKNCKHRGTPAKYYSC
jgi:hypothetical protein